MIIVYSWGRSSSIKSQWTTRLAVLQVGEVHDDGRGLADHPTVPAGASNVDATKAQAREHIEAAWERVSTFLTTNGPYLLGARVSAADFLMTMLMRWSRNTPRPTDTWPALFEHAARMKARPSFREVYARQGLTDWT